MNAFYNHLGFKRKGFNRKGFNRKGFNRKGFNRKGFNRKGFNRKGFFGTYLSCEKAALVFLNHHFQIKKAPKLSFDFINNFQVLV